MTRKHDDVEQTEEKIEQQADRPKDGGLSPEQELVLMQLATFDNKNHEALAAALREHPEMREQIIQFASANLGNDVVNRALALLQPTPAEQVANPEVAPQGSDPDAENAARFVEEQTEQQNTTDIASVPAPEQAEKVEVVEQIKADEPELLAATMQESPEVRDQVVVKATEELGAETVQQAIEVQVEQQQEAPAAEAELALEPEPVPAQAIEKVVEEPKQDTAQEEAWATKAREYNERHAALVEEFLAIVPELRLFDGTVDPTVIIAWQQENGVPVDGRIGPQTVAAARQGAKKVASVPDVVAAPEEQQITDDPPL